MPGIYIHIPFCKSKCSYCDFFSVAAPASMYGSVIDAMKLEMKQRRGFFGDRKVTTIYFGGGTPSLLSVEQTGSLLREAGRNFDLSQPVEVTAEVNPDDVTEEYASGLLSTGVNRLSMGVQSFLDRDLRLMNRRHDSARAEEAFSAARRSGFRNISIDLIYGIPGMSEREWALNLQKAVELAPEHISAYHLTIEPGTAFGRMEAAGKLSAVEEQTSENQYRMLRQTLCGAGYEHYEISNFAKRGLESRHNSSYWSGEKYIGIGPGAHSFDGERRSWNVAAIEGYLAAEAPQEELLSRDDKYNEYIMTRLRTARGVDAGEMERIFGAEKMALFLGTARKLLQKGMLVDRNGHYSIPAQKFLVSDNIIAGFFL